MTTKKRAKIDTAALTRVLERAMKIEGGPHNGSFWRDRTECMMDLMAARDCVPSMDIGALADFPDFDFVHDVLGIRRHMDRETAKLGGCFLPRCARG